MRPISARVAKARTESGSLSTIALIATNPLSGSPASAVRMAWAIWTSGEVACVGWDATSVRPTFSMDLPTAFDAAPVARDANAGSLTGRIAPSTNAIFMVAPLR